MKKITGSKGILLQKEKRKEKEGANCYPRGFHLPHRRERKTKRTEENEEIEKGHERMREKKGVFGNFCLSLTFIAKLLYLLVKIYLDFL